MWISAEQEKERSKKKVKNPQMIDKKLKKQVLGLSFNERAGLAHLLIDSLHPEQDFVSDEAWSEELQGRIDRYEKGVASTKSWDQVVKSVKSLLD